MNPEVFRITDYGGECSNGPRGGFMTEYYAVVGLGIDEIEYAHELGLPKRGSVHVNPNLGFVGTVQSVARVQDWPPVGWLARVRYNTTGTFNFGVRINSTSRIIEDDYYIPILTEITGNTNPSQRVFAERLPRLTVKRLGIVRIDTRKTGISPDTIAHTAARNLGSIYVFEGYPYQLANATASTDEDNVTRVETTFIHRHGFPLFPVMHFENQSVEIPELPPNADYDVDVSTGTIAVTDPLEIWKEGGFLPWIPD